MPCYDGRESDDSKEAQRRIDMLTRLLCEACGRLGQHGMMGTSDELYNWNIAHQKLDKERGL